ncbi:MAG TPA: TOBE domain-containing protein [Candidatus Dormibacteraeota bacterium]|nr:TOBE domain-containing protein [Candidatus Dormibacteraeota bacterium]
MASHLRIGQAAELLRVSPDTVRRLIDAGHIKMARSAGGQRQIDGAGLARYMASLPRQEPPSAVTESARNRFTGIITRVIKDGVAAQVEIQAGPHRIVSLITRESADELGLKAGQVAVASVKATNVGIEVPRS